MKRDDRTRPHAILRQLQRPVALLHGERDAVLSLAISRQAQVLVPAAVLPVLLRLRRAPAG